MQKSPHDHREVLYRVDLDPGTHVFGETPAASMAACKQPKRGRIFFSQGLILAAAHRSAVGRLVKTSSVSLDKATAAREHYVPG